VEVELLSAREALKTEQHEHSKLRATTELFWDAVCTRRLQVSLLED
jgi:hypothetical protein